MLVVLHSFLAGVMTVMAGALFCIDDPLVAVLCALLAAINLGVAVAIQLGQRAKTDREGL